jgi:hypothetical protein
MSPHSEDEAQFERNSETDRGMKRKNKAQLADRVARAAEAALAAKRFVAAVYVLVGIGWLDPGAMERWRRGQIDCLEGVVQAIGRVDLRPMLGGKAHGGEHVLLGLVHEAGDPRIESGGWA